MNKEIIIQPEIKFTATDFSTPVVTDDPANRTVYAKFNLIADDGQTYDYAPLLLWSGDEYDSIFWTNEDVVNRINELLFRD